MYIAFYFTKMKNEKKKEYINLTKEIYILCYY